MNDIKKKITRAIDAKSEQAYEKAVQFRLFVFADLKRNRFYYHCLYPSILANFTYSNAIAPFKDFSRIVDPSWAREGVVGWSVRNFLIGKCSAGCSKLICSVSVLLIRRLNI